MIKIELIEELFVPWILEDYNAVSLWENDCESPRDFAYDRASLIKKEHIKNWEFIKHNFTGVDSEENYIDESDDFEIEWV